MADYPDLQRTTPAGEPGQEAAAPYAETVSKASEAKTESPPAITTPYTGPDRRSDNHRRVVFDFLTINQFKNAWDASVAEPTGPEQEGVRDLVKKLGFDLVYFRSEDEQINRINGFVPPGEGKTMYLNAAAKKPALFVAGHELVHLLKRNHVDLYWQMVDALQDDALGFNEYLAKMEEGYVLMGKEAPGLSKGFEEYLADFMGQQFHQESFWKALYAKDATLAQKLMDVVRKVLTTIKEVLLIRSESMSPQMKGMFKDLDRAQEIITDTLATLAKAQEETTNVKEEAKTEAVKTEAKAEVGSEDFLKDVDLSKVNVRAQVIVNGEIQYADIPAKEVLDYNDRKTESLYQLLTCLGG